MPPYAPLCPPMPPYARFSVPPKGYPDATRRWSQTPSSCRTRSTRRTARAATRQPIGAPRWPRLADLDIRALARDVQPFLERPEDAALLDRPNLEAILTR